MVSSVEYADGKRSLRADITVSPDTLQPVYIRIVVCLVDEHTSKFQPSYKYYLLASEPDRCYSYLKWTVNQSINQSIMIFSVAQIVNYYTETTSKLYVTSALSRCSLSDDYQDVFYFSIHIPQYLISVSYTHLTLPTILRV